MEHRHFLQESLEPSVLHEEEKNWQEIIEKTREIVEREIDFNLIDSILVDVYKKCFPDKTEEQIKKHLGNAPPLFDVLYASSIDDKDHDGETDGNKIRLFARNFRLENGAPNVSAITKLVIHEILHKNTIKLEDGRPLDESEKYMVGVRDASLDVAGKETNYFIGLNEGLTEIIADAIYSEYVARIGSGDTTTYTDEKGRSHLFYERHLGYLQERLAIHDLVRQIAETAGLSIQEVYTAFTREYFTNGKFTREALTEAFKENKKITDLLQTLKRNLLPKVHSVEELQNMVDTEHQEESLFVMTLFNRDVIGTHNRKVVDSM